VRYDRHGELSPAASRGLYGFGEGITFLCARFSSSLFSLFSGASDEKVVGETSVGYLYSNVAAAQIKEFNPQAKIIIMLRNPVEMIYSLHSRQLVEGFEEIKDFEEALDAEGERKLGVRLPKKRYVPRPVLFYRELGKFSPHVKRFFDLFGRENVHVILFDDLKSDTVGVYSATCRFLGVSLDFQPDFNPGSQVINSNMRRRSLALAAFLRKPPSAILRSGKALMPRPLRRALVDNLWRFNVRYTERPTLNPELKKRLQEEFAPDVERLSGLLDRDLTHWCRD
jgi:sulfotransferase family protein